MPYRNNQVQEIKCECWGSVVTLNIRYIMKQLSGPNVSVGTGNLSLDADMLDGLIDDLVKIRNESRELKVFDSDPNDFLPELEQAKRLVGLPVRLSVGGPTKTVKSAEMADYIDPGSCPEKSNNLAAYLYFTDGSCCLYSDFLMGGAQ